MVSSDWSAGTNWYRSQRRPRFRTWRRCSQYLTMRDGTPIAVDLYLPDGAHQPMPTIVRQTRYYRGIQVARWLQPWLTGERMGDITSQIRPLFLTRGYAWLDVDTRGSGASFGTRPCPWSVNEIRDGSDIVSWIVDQPWSNGLVGTTGVSYDGTAAEMLMTNEHPAVRACAPRFSLFDTYRDVAFPGGLQLAWFTHAWGQANAALDRNQPYDFAGELFRIRLQTDANPDRVVPGTQAHQWVQFFEHPTVKKYLRLVLKQVVQGVRPVDDDPSMQRLAQAVRTHAHNFNVHDGAQHMVYRDDVPAQAPPEIQSISQFSPATYGTKLDRPEVAYLNTSGWYDGGYTTSAVARHRYLQQATSHLLLGPWNHGGKLNLSPFAHEHNSSYDHAAELLRFFDMYLDEGSMDIELPPVRYFQQGTERWYSSPCWPPATVRPRALYLSENRQLLEIQEQSNGSDTYEVDLSAGTGPRSRWHTILCPETHVDYPQRARQDQSLLVYDSPPLGAAFEVTGQPTVWLFLSSTASDGAFFAYLEELLPSGKVIYVTEGMLRGIHRRCTLQSDEQGLTRIFRSFLRQDADPIPPGQVVELIFELYPVSYRFQKGSRIRLALAGADSDHFAQPCSQAPTWNLQRHQLFPSRIVLPSPFPDQPMFT
jgi:uncharacterized protein